MPTLTSTDTLVIAAANLQEVIGTSAWLGLDITARLRAVRHGLALGWLGQFHALKISYKEYERMIFAAYGEEVVICARCDEPIEADRGVVDTEEGKAHRVCAERADKEDE